MDDDVAEKESGVDPVEKFSGWVAVKGVLRETLETGIAWDRCEENGKRRPMDTNRGLSCRGKQRDRGDRR